MNQHCRHDSKWMKYMVIAVVSLVCHDPVWSQILNLPLDGNGLDISGNNHHGQVYGTQPTSDRFGRPNRALVFNGVSDYIQVPDHPQLRPRSLSISLWFKYCNPVSNPQEYYGPALLCKGNVATATGYSVYHSSWFVPEIEIMVGRVGSEDQSYGPRISVTDGRWHHCVGEIVDTGGSGWLDGGLWIDGVGDIRDNCRYYLLASIVSDIYIGRNIASNRFFNGAIDDVRMYDRLLSPTEIQALYSEGGWPNVTLPPLSLQLVTPPTFEICPGDSVQLRAIVTGSYDRLVWRAIPSEYIRDSASTTITVRPTTTTTYRVHATLGEPCPERRDSIAVTIRVRPAPKFPTLGPKSICPGDSITIGADATGGTPPYRYQWRSAPGITDPSSVTQRVSPPSSRWYYVDVTDLNGCRRRDSVLVAVPGFPKLTLPARQTICRGTPDTIGVSAAGGSGGGYRYKWTPSAGLSNDSVAFPLMLADTSRRYVLRVTDGNDCSTVDTMDVDVVDPPVANAGPAITLCTDSSTTLGVPRVAGLRYRWTPSFGLNDSTVAQPTARPPATTTYTVEVTDTATGCTSIDSVEVQVVQFAMTTTTTTLDFGRLDGCTSSRELTLRLRNTGEGSLSVTATPQTNAFTASMTSTPVQIGPGDSAIVIVRYTPSGAGSHVDTLVLVADRCGIEQRIILRGVKDAAIARVAPNAIDLGARLVCDTSIAHGVVWVHNLGGDPMTVAGLATDAPFAATAINLPSTIAPGDSLSVEFALPTTPGVWSGEGRIAYSSGSCRDTLHVTLRGEVIVPTLDLPDPFDIGVITGCAGSLDTMLTVSNPTTLPMTIVGIDGGSIVSTQQPMPTTIDPSSNVSLQLRVQPTQRGPFSQRVSTHLSECDTTITFTLTGDYRGVVFTHVDTVDFGTIIACGDTTATVPFELTYSGGGGVTGRVVTATIDMPFGIDPIDGARLDSGVVYRTQVRFTPTSDGQVSGRLTLALEPCGATREVVLIGSRTSAALVAEPPVLDLGMINPGTIATGDIIYVNRGSVPVRVDRITGIAPPFSIRQTVPSTPSTLSTGETLRVTIDYTAQSGTWTDTANAILTEPCATVSLAEVRAGTNDDLRARLTANRFVAKAGDHRRISITLSEESGLANAGARSLETTLRFDASLLYVEPNQPGVTVLTDSAGWKRVRVEQAVPSVGGEAAGVNIVALLGKADRTDILIDGTRWLDANDQSITGIATTIEAGDFLLDGVCRQGSDRYVDGLGEFFLRPIIPTPTHGIGEIEFGIVEDGPVRVDAVDMNGRQLGTVLDASPGPGVYRFTVDVRGLSAGRYMVVLRSGRGVESVVMVVE